MAVLFVPAVVEAQTARVVLNATVSETATLSVAPTFSQSNVDVVSSGGNTVRITLSGDDAVIRVPLLVRSNSSFKISADFDTTTELSQLSVIDVHATGSLVSLQAVSAIDVRHIDLNDARPLLVASGPRVSLGGTLNSPNNALQITLLIRLQSQPARGSLTLVATAGPPTQ
jgi:hypothetical protein